MSEYKLPDDASAASKVREHITKETVFYNFGSEDSSHIPDAFMTKILTEANIARILDHDDNFRNTTMSLTDKTDLITDTTMYQTPLRMFATAVMGKFPLDRFPYMLKTYYKDRTSNNDEVEDDADYKPYTISHKEHPKGLINLINTHWIPYQEFLCVVHLKRNTYDTDLSEWTIPIICDPKDRIKVNNADTTVSHVRIFHDRHNIDKSDLPAPHTSASLALKEFSSRDAIDRIKTFLIATTDVMHVNLVTKFLGFTSKTQYYVLGELGDSNLRDFMRQHTRKDVDEAWLVDQLHGLADGLATFNEDVPSVARSIRDIIVFRKGEQIDLRLQIYPFEYEEQRVSVYRAPEYVPGVAPLAAQVDWVLGCRFLEVMVWFCQGWNALEEFDDKRVREDGMKGCFWKRGRDGRGWRGFWRGNSRS
jgi:hypothetical protein